MVFGYWNAETCDQVDDIIRPFFFVKSQRLAKFECHTKQRNNTLFRSLLLLLGGGTGVFTHDLCSKEKNEPERSIWFYFDIWLSL